MYVQHCSPIHTALSMGFREQYSAELLESFAQQQKGDTEQQMQYMVPCQMNQDETFTSYYATLPINKEQQVTIVPRTPSIEITEPIMLFLRLAFH